MTAASPLTVPLPACSAGTRSRARPAARRRRPAGTARTRPRSPSGPRPAEPGAGPGRPLHHRHLLPRRANLGTTPSPGGLSARQPRLVQLTGNLWKAAWCFHAPREPAAEDWVTAQGLDILHGRVSEVISRIRQLAADHPPRPGGEHAKIIRTTLHYLDSKQP